VDRKGESVSERMLMLRMTVGKCLLNVVSVYALQAGRTMEEMEEFYVMFGKVLSGIGAGEKLMICGDLNGHLGNHLIISLIFE
jgi:hypothetical protein